ncbi:MAG: hypothetical protein AB1555_12150 [Nitrospirota bacterium]
MKRVFAGPGSRTAVALLLWGALSGCLSPVAMHRAVLEYDHTVSQVESEMLLLNIARARQGLPVHFTAVSNVAATFDFRTNAGVGAQLFNRGGTDITRNFYTLNLGASVAENPTVSIIPIQGEEFTRRILTPMDETKFEFLISQGVEPAIVLRLMARGIGIEQDGKRTFLLNLPHRPEEYAEFRRRVLHLSALNLARQLHVGPLEHEEHWPLPPDHPLTAQALDKGYRWITNEADGRPILSKTVVGRMAISNYDPAKLPNHERRRLHETASRYPRNYVFVDIRPGFPGGDYPWRGQIKLRSFSAILGFVARGIAEEPEFAVDQDQRTGPVLRNPVSTLKIVETTTRPRHAAFAVELRARWYSVGAHDDGEEPLRTWNREAFSLLQQLFQMTVTDVGRIPTLPITIAK